MQDFLELFKDYPIFELVPVCLIIGKAVQVTTNFLKSRIKWLEGKGVLVSFLLSIFYLFDFTLITETSYNLIYYINYILLIWVTSQGFYQGEQVKINSVGGLLIPDETDM